MKISLFNSYFNNVSMQRQQSCGFYPNLAPLKKDTVSFGAMKKTQFDGVDFAVVEKFKAPIEKFKTNDDLQNWCAEKIQTEIIDKDFGGRQPETVEQRKHILKEWTKYVLNENDAYNNATALLILHSVTKDMKPNNDVLPPVLNKGVLADTVYDIDKNLKSNKKYSFDFLKMYKTKLKALYLQDTNTGEKGSRWIKIPSKEHDPENFEANVEKLKALSHKNWCTKTFNAKPYLADGDFHIYMVDGEPKIGIRFKGDYIQEIQGEANNNKLPVSRLNDVKAYIAENNFELEYTAEDEIKEAEAIEADVKKALCDLQEAIENNDAKTIFEYFGIKSSVDKDGYFTLVDYNPDQLEFSMEDLGISEQKLFSKVKTIKGNAFFRNSSLSSFDTLEEIGGNAYFDSSKIRNLGSLETIGGDASFEGSNVENLGNLITIGRNAYFGESEIKSLGNLEEIGRDVDFGGTVVEDLGNLEVIGGNVKFGHSQIKDLGKLTKVGYIADFRKSEITSLGNLESVGSDLILENSKVKDLGALQEVGGDMYIGNTEISRDDIYDSDIEIDGRVIDDVDDYYDY